jgi:NAD(P)-dependent dehydrogenase (short-subunit alcohol dehydrogenase family)
MTTTPDGSGTAYHAAKWALEGLSLAQEVAGFGVKVTLIEPTGYSTDWAVSSARHPTSQPVAATAQGNGS